MTVNIVNVGFKGTYPSSTASKTNYTAPLDTNGIFYFLGTNYGTSAWSNPQGGSHLIISGNSNFTNLIDRNLNTETTGGNSLTYTFNFLTCKVQPTGFYIRTNTTSTYSYSFNIQFSNDGSNWSNLATYSVSNNSGIAEEALPIASDKYYQYMRLITSFPFNALRVREIELYGNLFRTDGGQASTVQPITTVETLPKFIAEPTGVQDGDLLYYNGGIITNKRNTYYETERTVMSGDLTLKTEHFPNFYILDPNGATRTITLPSTPLDSQFFRLKTLNPTFAITIDSGGTIATLDTSTLVVDLYWDGTEWTALSYG